VEHHTALEVGYLNVQVGRLMCKSWGTSLSGWWVGPSH